MALFLAQAAVATAILRAGGARFMLALDKVVAGAKIRGVAGPAIVEVVRVEWIGSDALNVVYRSNDGPAEVLLYREAEPRLELVQASRASGQHGLAARRPVSRTKKSRSTTPSRRTR